MPRGDVGGGSKWLKDLVDDGSEERFNKARKLGRGLKEPRRRGKVGCAFCVILNKDGTCDVECGLPSEIACFDNSPGRIRRTAVWISREEMVDFLEYAASS